MLSNEPKCPGQSARHGGARDDVCVRKQREYLRRCVIAAAFGAIWHWAGPAGAQEQSRLAGEEARVLADLGAAAVRSFDYPEACTWYALAAALDGGAYLRHFEGVTLLLSEPEVSDCLAAARAWRPEMGGEGEN